LDRLTAWAPPAASDRIRHGRRRTGPLACTWKMEDGETAVARPDRGGSAHHVIADHALHSPTRQLVLDLLH
jgi:hypothetical protein